VPRKNAAPIFMEFMEACLFVSMIFMSLACSALLLRGGSGGEWAAVWEAAWAAAWAAAAVAQRAAAAQPVGARGPARDGLMWLGRGGWGGERAEGGACGAVDSGGGCGRGGRAREN